MSVKYVLPTAVPQQSTEYDLSLAANVLPNKVGMLANGFPDADKFLAKQADALLKLWPGVSFRIDKKANANQLNIGIREPLLSELVDDCDAMVIAWGHCGSCTSGVARDTIAFAERGIPSVMLVCDVFWDYSEWIGKAFGMSGLARVRLPFPLAGTGENNQLDWAERLAPQIIDSLSRH